MGVSLEHFQADDEGSIPFTRSNYFKDLTRTSPTVDTFPDC